MFFNILEYLSGFVVNIISAFGYLGVFFCMVVESACIPLPSEIIMPFSGYLVFLGKLDLFWVVLSGAFGNLVGSIIAYGVGIYGGRAFVEKYGKYFLVSHHDLETADRWFSKYGDKAVFFSRMLPVVRTFISLPAGIARMNFVKFSVYSFIGSIPWCLALALVGVKLGEHWNGLHIYFQRFDMLIGAVMLVFMFLWLKRHLKQR